MIYNTTFMKYILVPMCFLLISFQKQHNVAHATADDIDSMIAWKINSDITTPIDIKGRDIMTRRNAIKFDLSLFRARILNVATQCKPRNETWEVDSRALLVLWYRSGRKDTMCVGNLPIISINGRLYDMPNRDIPYLLDSLYFDAMSKLPRQ